MSSRGVRLKLLEVTAQLLRRDGLVDLAETVEWALTELAPLHDDEAGS